MITPIAQTLTEVIADRVVTIVQIVAFCYCWHRLLTYGQRCRELKGSSPSPAAEEQQGAA